MRKEVRPARNNPNQNALCLSLGERPRVGPTLALAAAAAAAVALSVLTSAAGRPPSLKMTLGNCVVAGKGWKGPND